MRARPAGLGPEPLEPMVHMHSEEVPSESLQNQPCSDDAASKPAEDSRLTVSAGDDDEDDDGMPCLNEPIEAMHVRLHESAVLETAGTLFACKPASSDHELQQCPPDMPVNASPFAEVDCGPGKKAPLVPSTSAESKKPSSQSKKGLEVPAETPATTRGISMEVPRGQSFQERADFYQSEVAGLQKYNPLKVMQFI